MASKKVKVTQEYINSLKSRVATLEGQLKSVEEDRNKHREFFVKLLRDTIDIHGRSNHWSMNTLIERLAKHMNNVSSWYWC